MMLFPDRYYDSGAFNSDFVFCDAVFSFISSFYGLISPGIDRSFATEEEYDGYDLRGTGE
jgi:hypothetical protein